MNKVQLIGFVGKDPELKQSATGHSCVQLNICTNERGKRLSDGTLFEDRTEWHKGMMWGRSAEIIAATVKRGNRIYVEGRLRNYKYTDPETGIEHKSCYVVIDYYELLTTRKYPYTISVEDPDGEGKDDNVTKEDVEMI